MVHEELLAATIAKVPLLHLPQLELVRLTLTVPEGSSAWISRALRATL